MEGDDENSPLPLKVNRGVEVKVSEEWRGRQRSGEVVGIGGERWVAAWVDYGGRVAEVKIRVVEGTGPHQWGSS